MANYPNNENYKLCAACGGKCCLYSGCEYFTEDIKEFTLSYLESMLATGRVSISAAIEFIYDKENKEIKYALYLRSRSINRDRVELLSISSPCNSLENNHCYYDFANRPSGGKKLIPGKTSCYCDYDEEEELNKWQKYQDLLSKLIEMNTGLKVEERIRYEAIKILEDVLNGRYLAASDDVCHDIKLIFPNLVKFYPTDFEEILVNLNNENNTLSRRKEGN